MNKTTQIAGACFAALLLTASLPQMADAQRKPVSTKAAAPARPQQAAPARPQTPARPAAQTAKPSVNNRSAVDTRGNTNNRPGNVGNDRLDNNRPNASKPGGNNVNAGNRNNIGNNVNINVDNSKDIRINNNRNTAVRRAPNYRPYPRPPYVYGGFRYYTYHPFFYFPYRPFVWGPMWHPWGYFVATLATTAIIISIVDNDMPSRPDPIGIMAMAPAGADFNGYRSGPRMWDDNDGQTREGAEHLGGEYWYDQGVYYVKSEGGYTVVAAPVGATIKTLPTGYETAKLDDGSVNYHYGGAFYEKTANCYTVVPPTAGTLIEHLSDGGEEVKIGDVTYVKLGDTYYQPVKVDGKNMYEVASVEEEK